MDEKNKLYIIAIIVLLFALGLNILLINVGSDLCKENSLSEIVKYKVFEYDGFSRCVVGEMVNLTCFDEVEGQWRSLD